MRYILYLIVMTILKFNYNTIIYNNHKSIINPLITVLSNFLL